METAQLDINIERIRQTYFEKMSGGEKAWNKLLN